jgi:hypothetical protein
VNSETEITGCGTRCLYTRLQTVQRRWESRKDQSEALQSASRKPRHQITATPGQEQSPHAHSVHEIRMTLAQQQNGQQDIAASNQKTNKCKQIHVEDSGGLTAVPVAGERGFASQSARLHISKKKHPSACG